MSRVAYHKLGRDLQLAGVTTTSSLFGRGCTRLYTSRTYAYNVRIQLVYGIASGAGASPYEQLDYRELQEPVGVDTEAVDSEGAGEVPGISASFRRQIRGTSRGASSCSLQPSLAETSGSNVKGIAKWYSIIVTIVTTVAALLLNMICHHHDVR